MIQLSQISITASDPSGQRRVSVEDVPADSSVGELIDRLSGAMNLGARDRRGRLLTIQARLDREGRHLHRSERAQDCLKPGDHLVMHPKIAAGGIHSR